MRGRYSALVPLAIASLWIVLLGRPAVAQDVTEPALKAAFIYNFARFTTWPVDAPPGDSFVICVLNDTAVAEALEHAVAGRSLTERPVSVSAVASSAPKKACRVLYMAGLPVARAAEVVAELRDVTRADDQRSRGLSREREASRSSSSSTASCASASTSSPPSAPRLQISSRLLIMARTQMTAALLLSRVWMCALACAVTLPLAASAQSPCPISASKI